MGRDELREVLLRQVDSDHLAALTGHAQGRGETDAAAGACDDDGAAGEGSPDLDQRPSRSHSMSHPS